MSEWIDREDMLELTRRMTPARTHFIRIAGAYMDEEGFVDGTFNTHFLKLSAEEKKQTLDISKAVLFSRTNEELCQYKITRSSDPMIWKLLDTLKRCELKNDGLLLTLYEAMGEKIHMHEPYAIYVYYGAYDVPVKASDKERLDESQELYSYLIVAVSPLMDADTPGMPVSGLLYPAFSGRSEDADHVNVFQDKASGNGDFRAFLGL